MRRLWTCGVKIRCYGGKDVDHMLADGAGGMEVGFFFLGRDSSGSRGKQHRKLEVLR